MSTAAHYTAMTLRTSTFAPVRNAQPQILAKVSVALESSMAMMVVGSASMIPPDRANNFQMVTYALMETNAKVAHVRWEYAKKTSLMKRFSSLE